MSKEWEPIPERQESTHLYRNRTPAKVRRNAEQQSFKAAQAAVGEVIKAQRAPRPEPVWVRERSTDGRSTRSYTV